MNIELVKKQLSRLRYLLSQPATDVCWSNYNSADEVIKELDILEKGIASRDYTTVRRLISLLAPTGQLQEISISSGWGDEFLDIAASLERELDKRLV